MLRMPWIVLLLLLLLLYVVPWVSSFSLARSSDLTFQSCAAPRFDQFAESIVGPWYCQHQWTTSTSTATTTTTTPQLFHVEEVMRSCGGAVQGIREIAMNSTTTATQAQGQYLNRADDGFLPMNDASYTWGATQLPISKEEDNTPAEFATSIAWDKNLRLFLTNANVVAQSKMMMLQRKQNASVSYFIQPFPDNDNKFSMITWTHHVRCRMPSDTMPWMVPRLQWEECHTPPEHVKEPSSSSSSSSSTIFFGQSPTIMTTQQLAHDWNVPNSCWTNQSAGSIVIWSAVACHDEIRATGREYYRGQLVSVLWSQGGCFGATG